MRGVALLAVAGLLPACGEEPAKPPEAPAPEQAAPAGPGWATVYTTLDLEQCTLLDSETEEGTSASWRCPGFGETALLVEEGDGRFDVDAGVKNDRFETLAAFNDLGETFEWRLRDGVPVAVIFRYRDATPEGQGRTVLAVEKVGTASVPGCRVAQVAGAAPDANEAARDLADTSPGFVCGRNAVELVGNAR